MREPGEKGINFQINPLWAVFRRQDFVCAGQGCLDVERGWEEVFGRKSSENHAGTTCYGGCKDRKQGSAVRKSSKNHRFGWKQGSTAIFQWQHLLCVQHPAPHVHQLKAAPTPIKISPWSCVSVDLRTSVIILESNDKKIPYYSKAIISWSVCAITGEYGIDFLINYAITYILALG